MKLVRDKGLPLIVVGGGGYVMRNVSRCWTYETAMLAGEELSNDLPYNGNCPVRRFGYASCVCLK